MTARSSVSKPASRPSTASADCGFGRASAVRPVRDVGEIEELVVGEHVAHAVARAVAPQREHDALAGRLQRFDMSPSPPRTHWRRAAVRSGAKLRPGRVPASRIDAAPFGRRERREAHQRRAVEPLAPFRHRRDRADPAAAACMAPPTPICGAAAPGPGCAPRSNRRSGRSAPCAASSASGSSTTGVPGR